jgi:hypothetical protein
MLYPFNALQLEKHFRQADHAVLIAMAVTKPGSETSGEIAPSARG